jgi:hypothetical protein
MRRAAKTDSNHAEIVSAFRKFGCSVLDISQLKNCGDLVVAKHLKMAIVEVKDGSKPPSQRRLTKGEEKFMEGWKGLYFVVESLEDVISLVRGLER